MSFALQGAGGRAVADRARARFGAALGSVDVDYEAHGDAVKETLTLHDAGRGSFVFRLRASDGLRARMTTTGGVDLVDDAGEAQFALPPPFVYDDPASGEGPEIEDRAAYELQPSGDGWLLRLMVDDAWLASPARRFPVTVDPTVSVLVPFLDCTITSAAPSTSDCSSSRLLVGRNGAQEYRATMRFGVDAQSVIPKDAVVLASRLALHEFASDISTLTPFAAYRLGDASTSSATWTTNDGTHAWTPGAPFDPQVIDSSPAGTGAAWRYLRLDPALTQGWLDGSIGDNGFLIKGTDTTANRIWFDSSETANPALRPQLEISWEPRLGLERQYSYESQRLSDRMGADVNVANGNLVLSNNDLQITGTGIDLGLTRYYNSKSARTSNPGYGWSFETGRDVSLSFAAEGSAIFYGPSGFSVPFTAIGSAF